MMINLISDTITLPTKGMLQAMAKAEVGDDVFGADPTVNALEAYSAELFGREAALFCPSGTMTNQIAIKVHTRPLDEVICDEKSHIFQSEVGGYAFHSGVGVNLLHTEQGILTAEMIRQAIKPQYDWLPRSTLAVLENTCNKGGGSCYSPAALQEISLMCRQNGLKLHLDGARIFNAMAATDLTALQTGAWMDSISVCLSKGLGAPMGSLLIGDAAFIKEARRVRKAMGGGMRQAGYMAAAGLYALRHQIDRLQEDHENARALGNALSNAVFVEKIYPIETNIVLFELKKDVQPAVYLEKLKEKGILAIGFGGQLIRMVTHLNVSRKDILKACVVINR